MSEYDFGDWLLNEMEKHGYNREQLAKKAGIHKVSVGCYLNYSRLPNLSTFLLILDALGKKMKIVDKKED